MGEIIKGIVKEVCNDGSIRIDNKYFEPANDIISKITVRDQNKIFNKGVSLTLNDNGKYKSVTSNDSATEKIEVANNNFSNAKEIETEPKEQYAEIDSISDYDYKKIRKIKCNIDKKNNFSYVSWSHAWDSLKQLYQNSTYNVKENSEGYPLFKCGKGGMVKVTVIVENVSHSIWMPVMNYMNKSISFENIDAMDINKAIQRGLTKAIALHGLGLYVYHGEDLPSKD